MKKTIFTVLAIGLACLQTAMAETKLTLSSWLPPTHPVVSQMIVPWAAAVKKATEGRVTINILAKGLGHPKVHYDVARDGMADITYSAHGYTPGRFTLTKIAELPFTGDSAEAISVAYWKIYEKYLAKANEHKGTKLLGLFTHGPGHVHNSKRDIVTVDDFKGLKVRVGGDIANDVAQKLGVTPLLKPSSSSYELLSHGVADGIFFPLESVTAFKIDEIVTHTTLIPGGLYNMSFFLVMNERKFKHLSQQDQEAIMSVSGEVFAKLAGSVWDAVDAKALEALKSQGNHIATADAKLMADIKAKVSYLDENWINAAKKKGVDGQAALQAFRAFIKDYQ